MATNSTKPSTEDLWMRLNEQAARVKRLEDELERQRTDKLSLASRLAEVEGGHGATERRLSRAGLLKAALAATAGAVGATVLGSPGAEKAVAAVGQTAVYDAYVATFGQSPQAAAQTTGFFAQPNAGFAAGVEAYGTDSGVIGHSSAVTGAGIHGLAAGAFQYGVRGDNSLGDGVYGTTDGGTGVEGFAFASGVGVEARSVSGVGLRAGGGGAPLELLPANSDGPPQVGGHGQGEVWVDAHGMFYICTTGGVPGTWVPLQMGNGNLGDHNSLFTAVSTQQYTLASSDGTTWYAIDSTNLSLSITPGFKALAIITGNSDLWTSNAGYNQDIGIAIGGGSYPTTSGQPEAWKESGGFAGTFSPNAASVQTVQQLALGTSYTIKLQWKANKNAPGATIWAGAGPIGGKFSPTRLTVMLVPIA